MFSFFSLLIYILVAVIGFTMAFLYKNAQTNNLVVNPNPPKTYRLLLTLYFTGVVILALLAFLTVRTLHSSPIPEDCAMQYKNYKSVYFFVLTLFFIGLTIIANYYTLSISKLRIVPYIFIACFYVLFILADVHYISERYAEWQLQNLPGEETLDFAAMGWIKCGLGASVTALNGILMWWGKRK